MPYTIKLQNAPTAFPSVTAPFVDKDGRLTPEWHTFIVQLREWLKPADAALRELEP